MNAPRIPKQEPLTPLQARPMPARGARCHGGGVSGRHGVRVAVLEGGGVIAILAVADRLWPPAGGTRQCDPLALNESVARSVAAFEAER
jgi:hypothetical protein